MRPPLHNNAPLPEDNSASEEPSLPSYWKKILGPSTAVLPHAERIIVPEPPAAPQSSAENKAQWAKWYSQQKYWQRHRQLVGLGVILVVSVLCLIAYAKPILDYIASLYESPLETAITTDLVYVARPDVIIPANTLVKTDAHFKSQDSRVNVIRVRGGGNLRIDRDTVLELQHLGGNEDTGDIASFSLTAGRAFAFCQPKSLVDIETSIVRVIPSKQIPTCYEIQHSSDPSGKAYTIVRVFSGQARICTASGYLVSQTLKSRQQLKAYAHNLGAVSEISPPYDNWSHWNNSWQVPDQIATPNYPNGNGVRP